MTKAERIFNDTYTEARVHIKNWGYKEGESFNRLVCSDDESVCKRTINSIMKLVESEKKSLITMFKVGVITYEDLALKLHAIYMVELTAERQTV